jgi:hypothetical protein
MSEENYNEDFLHELKYTFEQGITWKNSLDNKANNMITMSSAITTFLITLVTFLFSRISIGQSFYPIIILMLLVAIISAIVAILYFIRSYSIKNYCFPLGHEAFFRNGEYNEEQMNNFLSYSNKEFKEHMIEEYLECMKTNSANINDKSVKIKCGQYFYLCSIIAIVIILVIIFVTELK